MDQHRNISLLLWLLLNITFSCCGDVKRTHPNSRSLVGKWIGSDAENASYMTEQNALSKNNLNQWSTSSNYLLTSRRSNESTSWPYPTCKVTLSTPSAEFLQSLFRKYKPNFARIKLVFKHHRVNYRSQVIRPFHWIWTYESRKQLFSYITWPADFSIFSFGLLNRYTLPDGHTLFLNVENSEEKCSLIIGERETNEAIGEALAVLTRKYIYDARPDVDVNNSFWCYHAQVPTIYNSVLHKLRIYTSFPIEVALYNCCRIVNQSTADCNLPQRHRAIEGLVIPYIISFLAFAYFPLLLVHIYKYSQTTETQGKNGYRNIQDETDHSFLYLSTGSPVSFTKMICNVFGLRQSYPFLAARLLRLSFLLLLICPIVIRIFIYKKYLYDIVVALVRHRCPIGFVTMISGYYESKRVFVTALGGPFVVLFVFCIVSVIFFVVPGDIDTILEKCSSRNIEYNSKSPLFFNIHALERFSNTPINDKYGFLKAGSMCVSGVYMLTNPFFWQYTAKMFFDRFVNAYIEVRNRTNRFIGFLAAMILVPVVSGVNCIELTLIILVYGLPIINFASILARGFMLTLMDVASAITSRLGRSIVVKAIIILIIVSSFVYYIICFCSIFMDTCIFLSKMVVFTFLAVIVYPGASFGYVFYGIVFIYYAVSITRKFGESYHALLKDVIEISKELYEDRNEVKIFGKTLLFGDMVTERINDICIHDKVIPLTPEQKATMAEAQGETVATIVKPKSRNPTSELGVPRTLYWRLVATHQPIHKLVAFAVLKLVTILCLLLFMLLIESRKHDVTEPGFSEIMNVLFLIAIGGLPKFLECSLCKTQKVHRGVDRGSLRSSIWSYWTETPELEIVSQTSP